VRSEVRHRLKEDRLATTAQGTFSWMREHSVGVVGVVLALTIATAIVLGGWYYMENREQKASAALGSAMETLNAHVGAPDPNPEGSDESYNSVKDRGQAAQKKLEAVADQYSHTRSGKIARYLVGVAQVQQGNNTAAEATFKQAAASGDKDVASMAKLALASLYRSMNRNPDAIALYKDLVDHPTHEVSKLAAQFELAGVYETTQPDEARKLYEEIQKSDPEGPIGQQAMMKMLSIQGGGASPFSMQMPR
jgi:predicted negative regulator of RcsB-dependent stress response